MLEYKTIRFGKELKVVNEKFSTVTCSFCFNRTGPSGLSTLGVREWTCTACGVIHDRDVNAAQNILRIASDTPIKGDVNRDELDKAAVKTLHPLCHQ